jgi:phage terminase large subunit GpA-like protein
MLGAEEQLSDGSFDARGRRNEALDCRVYAMCAADVWLDVQVETYRKFYRDQGHSALEVQAINSKWVLDYLAAQLVPPKKPAA